MRPAPISPQTPGCPSFLKNAAKILAVTMMNVNCKITEIKVCSISSYSRT